LQHTLFSLETAGSFRSFLFLGLGEFEGDLSDHLKKLRVLALESDDLRERWLSPRLLGDPSVYGVLRDTVFCFYLDDGDAVVLDTVDNVLPNIGSDSFFNVTCINYLVIIQDLCTKFGGRASRFICISSETYETVI